MKTMVIMIDTIAPTIVDTNCIVFFLSAEKIDQRKPTNEPKNTDINKNVDIIIIIYYNKVVEAR